MASRTTTDPIEILLEMGVDLDNLSEEEDYLSALMEAVNTLTIKDASDPRIGSLADEIRKVRQKRKAADPKFKARKTKISADSFKKGSVTGSNFKPKALPTSAIVSYQAPEAEEEESKKAKTTSKKAKTTSKKEEPKNLLAEIAASVTNIADILKDQYKLNKNEEEYDRKKAQDDKRKLQEAGLEKRFKTVFKTAQKIIAPVRSLFDRILGFIFNILLAKFLTKLVDWIANPENQKKVQSIIRFFGDHWKKLLSLYIVFGTGLGRFIKGLTTTLLVGTLKLGAALAKLAAAKGIGSGLQMRRIARFLGGRRAGLIATGVGTALTLGGTMGVVNTLTGEGGEQQTQGFSGGGLAQPKIQPAPQAIKKDPQKGMLSAMKGAALGSIFGPIGALAGAGIGSLFDKFSKKKDDTVTLSKPANIELKVPSGTEGQVDGPGGTDKVPAMLTAGEFVMSRGAVQKFGVGQLEAMNAAGGGTNEPKVVDDTVLAAGGGMVGLPGMGGGGGGTNALTSQAKARTIGSVLSDPFLFNFKKKQFNDPQNYLTDEDFKNRGRGAGGPGGLIGFPQLGGGGGGLDALTNQAKVRSLRDSLLDPTGIKARRAFFNDPNAYLSDEDFQNRGIFPEDRNRRKRGRGAGTGSPQGGYDTGSLLSNPLGAIDRILGQSTGGRVRLPGRGKDSKPDSTPDSTRTPDPKSQPKPPKPPKSQPKPPKSQPKPPKSRPKEPLIPESPGERVGSNEKGFIENLTGPGGQTFLDSGLIYLSQMLGTSKPITEADFGEESEKQLLLAVERAKKRQKNVLETQRAKVARYVAQGYETSEEGRRALAIERSFLQKLEEGKIQVKYQDYFDGNDPKNMTESADNARRIFGQFWAKKRSEEEGGGYRVEDKYDFDWFEKKDENDPNKKRKATHLEVADIAMSGLPLKIGSLYRGVKSAITGEEAKKYDLQQSLQALYLLNPFKSSGEVDTVLGGERDLPFMSGRGSDFGGSKIPPESLMGTDKKTPEKPKLTAQQIKNNQAYAASKGKYYSSTTGKTYANYAAALKDPAVAAGAKKIQQKRQSTMAMLMGGKDAYYSSTTGQYYKNYTEALKDPKVAAAAKVEETKKKLSFAPTQQPKVSAPPPPQNSPVNITKLPSSSNNSSNPMTDRGGSVTPNISAGNGDKSKFNIFGIPAWF